MWEKYFVIKDIHGSDGEYTIWVNKNKGKPYYNITKDSLPPKLQSGYFLLSSLLRLKGL